MRGGPKPAQTALDRATCRAYLYIWIRFLPYVWFHPERLEHPQLLSRTSKRPCGNLVGLRNGTAIRRDPWRSNGCVFGSAICAMAPQTETNQKQVWNGVTKRYKAKHYIWYVLKEMPANVESRPTYCVQDVKTRAKSESGDCQEAAGRVIFIPALRQGRTGTGG